MKIAQYNDMMSYLTRPGFKDGDTVVPPPKPLTESQVKNKLDLYIKGFIGGFDKMEMIDLMNEISKKADESGVMSQEDVFNFVQERKDFYQKFLEENKGEGIELPRQKFADGLSVREFGEMQSATTAENFQRQLTPSQEGKALTKVVIQALKEAGIKYVPAKGSGSKATFDNVTEKTIELFNKEATKLKAEEGLPMSRYQTEKIKKSKQFKEYRKGTFEDIKEALNCIPPRVPGSGTYDYYRNLLWGLVKACHDANKSESDAISLMQQHSPQWRGIDQVARSGGKLIEAGTFWYLARESGYNPPKLVEIKSIENPDTPVVMEKQPLQKIEANQLMEQLRKKNKGDKPFRYNIFTQQIEEGEDVCEGENSLERYYIKLADSGIKVSKDLAFDCVVQAARENEYDPVKEYLLHVSNTEELTYIDQLATTYLRPEDKAIAPTIYDKMLKCTLIAAVARVLKPGCKFDNCFVIVGKQGARKSTFWSTLGGPFFSDALKDISNKDSLMVLHRSWIMEYSELDFLTTRKQAGEVKAFLSQATDIFRVPYGKSTEVFKRRGIIVGTSNKTDGLLMDDSGNRRFWICQTTRDNINQIDCDGLLRERNSIWASAVSAYLNEEPWTLDSESEEIVNNENVKYLIDSPWKSVVESYINEPKNRGRELTTEVVLTEAIEKPIERQTRGDQMQIASILRDLGLVKKRRGDRSSRKWVYIRDLDTISV